MTLRRKLDLRYACVAGACLLLLAGLAHHEFVVEPRVRRELGQTKPSGSDWGEYAEMVFHGGIPIVLGIGWWMMRRTLNPLNELTLALARIHPGDPPEPLPRSTKDDEVDRLAKAFEDLLGRVERSFRQVQEFTLHASHELKTPLTVMRGQIESLLRDDPGLSTARQDWLRSQLDEVQRLADIVDALALLTRADTGLVELERQPVPLAALVRECFEDARILGEMSGLAVSLAACEDVEVIGDRHRLRQLLLNLADNAAKYNHPGGSITLAVRRKPGYAEISVQNTGPGIPRGEENKVFERFVRNPGSRHQTTDGCGLGLPLCRWIAHSHAGSIRIFTDPAGLTTALVHLPCRAS